MSDNCKICGDAGIVPYQKGIKCKEELCPYWRQHQANIGGCSKRFQYKRRCKLCVCVHSELQPRANTMSDKPIKGVQEEYKSVKVLKPFCPICKEQLSGKNSIMLPYKCSCGTWKRDMITMRFNIKQEARP